MALNSEDIKRIIIEAIKYRYENFEHYELDVVSQDELMALEIVSKLETDELKLFTNFTSNSNDLTEVLLPVK